MILLYFNKLNFDSTAKRDFDAKSAIETEAIDCDWKTGRLPKDHLRPGWPNMVISCHF